MSLAVELQMKLDEPYPVTEPQITRFREDGFIKLKNVFGQEVLDFIGEEITRLTLQRSPLVNVPMEKRNTYAKAFLQVGNLWRESEIVKALSLSRRVGHIATQLLGTAGVRMYHDQALYKEAGGGFTPWHVDQQYWPLSTGKSITAWIPLQAVPTEMGPLCFGKGSHVKNIARDVAISDESERIIREQIKEHGLMEVYEPYDAGEISFHLGWTLHRAGPNTTSAPRKVHTIIMIDRDMRLAEPKNKNQQSDWDNWSPGTKIGAVMDSPLNPIIYEN